MAGKKTKSNVFDLGQVRGALRRRHPSPEWALFFELRNGVGHSKATRYADAVAFNLFPSRGMEVHGYEFKRTRSDLRRELLDPHKSADIQKHCDRWWLVLMDPSICREEDVIPPTWGVLIPHPSLPSQFKIQIPAPKLERVDMDHVSLCAVLRAAYETMLSPTDSQLAQARQEGYAEGRETGRNGIERELKYVTNQKEDLERKIREFEQVTGLNFGSGKWAGQEYVKYMRRLKHLRHTDPGDAFNAIKRLAHQVIEGIEKHEQFLKELDGEGDNRQNGEATHDEVASAG